MIGSPGQDSYQADPGEMDEWAEALDRAAATAATAAAGDSRYDGLAAAAEATRDDIAHVRDVLADDGTVMGDELTAIEDRVGVLVAACAET